MEEKIKLYSQKAIGFATYLGGPLAAGILVRQNCINLNRDRQGLNALFIGIFSTILLFVGIISIPDKWFDFIPSFLIPAIYVALVYFIVEKIQGKDLKLHKENEGEFYPLWKAPVIGLISLGILAGLFFGFAYLETADWDAERYDAELEKYNQNEIIAMQLFEMLDNNTIQEIVYFIDHKAIPKWKESIGIIEEMNGIENIPPEFLKQNKLLLEYCQLRITSYGLIRKAIFEGSSQYDAEIIKIHARIDEIIAEL